MAKFHSLDVTNVQKTIRDAVVITLKPRDDDARAFEFTQGHYLTFRRDFDGEEIRRSYSICAGRDDDELRVGIKRVEGGSFSNWVNDVLQPGDTMEAMPPMGGFHTTLNPDAEKYYIAFAGGSGITPVLSIIKTTLSREPKSRVTLLYANRSVSTIMFREELEDLKNTYLGRFNIIHVLKDDAQDIDLFTGRIDEAKCDALFAGWVDIRSVDMAYICGPEPMMLGIAKSLRKHGLSDDQIKYELFASAQPGRAKRKATASKDGAATDRTMATVTLDGASRIFQMRKDGLSVLEAVVENDMDVPHACKAGVCATCRAKLLEGEVEMVTNHALEDYEVQQGYILTCQSYPLSDKIVVDYDQ